VSFISIEREAVYSVWVTRKQIRKEHQPYVKCGRICDGCNGAYLLAERIKSRWDTEAFIKSNKR
jgi:hypothetical protein